MTLAFAAILVPLGAGALGLAAWRSPRTQVAIAVAGSALHLAAACALLAEVSRHGIVAVQVGGWPAPFGISLVADTLGALLATLTAVVGLACTVHAAWSERAERRSPGAFPLVSILLAGVSGAFLTGDLFNLYVWFEVMLIASFVLVALEGGRPHLSGGVRYLALNLVASGLFLAAIGFVYALAGTLNLADLSVRLRAAPPEPLAAILLLLVVAFGIKSASFPLFFWLPASYPAPPPAITALFSALLTKVGVYAMLRCVAMVFAPAASPARTVLLVAAALTMVTGVLGAVAQTDVRRLLSFHVVSQIGYLLLGIAIGTPVAIAATIFFTLHVALAKSTLFLVGGLAERAGGSFDLRALGGLARREPLVAAVFLVAALSLAGLPPLSGFFAKVALVRATLSAGQGALVAVALAVSLLTLLSMTKIWNEAFWKRDPRAPAEAPSRAGRARTLPAAALAAFSVVLGLAPGPLFALCLRAANELMDPAAYVASVLGGAP